MQGISNLVKYGDIEKARRLACFVMVETTRLELVTSTMSTWRSNQLGYASITLISYTNFA